MFLPTMDVPAKVQKDYRLVLAASLSYGLVDGLLFITMALYVNTKSSGSLPMVGFITSLPFLAVFLMSFVWGAAADKIGSYKWPIVFGNLITGVLFFPMPYLDMLGLFGLRAVQVFFYSVNVLGVAMVTEMLPGNKGEGTASVSLWTSVGWLLGGVISGVVYFYGGMPILFPLCGILSFVTGSIIVFVGKSDKPKAVISIKDTFKLSNSRVIGFMLFLICMTYIANRAVFTVFPVYLTNIQHLNPIQIGLFSATAGIVGAIVVVTVGRVVDKKGRRPMFIFAIFSYLAIWLVLLFTDNFWLVLMVWMVPSWSFMSISAMSMISDLTTRTERGRGIGAFNSALNLGQFIGAMISGLVASWLVPAIPSWLAVHEFKGVWLFAVLLLIIPFFLAFKVPETLRMRLGKKKGAQGPDRKASKEEE
jgi:MFS family permease